MSVRVAFVIVSHSEALARGVCELAAQMAPDVRFEAAGGTDDGRIGTSYDRVESALEAALASVGGEGSGVVVLTDLGSATMTVESVIEMCDEPERVRFVDTCLVEGAVASSVRAQLGESLSQVAEAAACLAPRLESEPSSRENSTDAAASGGSRAPQASSTWAQADATVADPVGLHARPAAAFVRLAGKFDAEVTVNGADGGSVLELMALGVGQGESVHIEANGVDATAAVAALADMLNNATEHTTVSKETT